jgi:hypothetical protein
MPISIVDLYFYEELCRVAGHETGSQWLLEQHNKQRRLKRTASGITGISCPSPLYRTSEITFRSAPASPRSQRASLDGASMAGHHGRTLAFGIDLCTESYSSNIKSFTDSFPLQRTGRNSLDLALNNAVPSHSPPPLIKPDSPMMGLVFTDAAHSVLD